MGIIGGLLVSAFLYEAFCDWISSKPIIAISELTLSWVKRHSSIDTTALIVILAVSWDALWSGGAKSAQAQSGMWNSEEVFFSFLIAGVVVAIFAQLSLFATRFVGEWIANSRKAFIRFSYLGLLAESTIIGTFGFMSFWNAGVSIWGLSNLWVCLIVSFAFWAVIFLYFKQRLLSSLMDEFS